MKTCNILCVCGSGTVSSAMVAGKLKEKLKEQGWDASMVEASPNSIESTIAGKHFDLITCVSPVYDDYGIPKVKEGAPLRRRRHFQFARFSNCRQPDYIEVEREKGDLQYGKFLSNIK